MAGLYFFPFVISFLVTSVLVWYFLFLAKRFKLGIDNRDSKKRINTRHVSRLGGAAIIIGFLIAILTDINLVISYPLWGVIFATLFIFLAGLWDDFWELDWRTQLFFQITVSIFVFIMGVQVQHITNPFGGVLSLNLWHYPIPSLLVTIGWIVLLMNATNWLDGIDGLSGSVTFIGAFTIFFLSLKPEVNQPPVGIITMALAGAVLGFLIFNIHPAKIFAGTAGSMFMGFILAVLAIFAGTKIATALLVLVVPIVDSLWVIGERLRAGDSIFEADNRHLHFKLRELGWSPRKIMLYFFAFTTLTAIVALNTRALGKAVTIILSAAIVFIFIFLISRKLKNGVAKTVSQ